MATARKNKQPKVRQSKKPGSQFKLLPSDRSEYGGDLRNSRKGRLGPRPLAVKHTMHFTLRSSYAKGVYSFRIPKNQRMIREVFAKFGKRFGVQIIDIANVGNHIHAALKVSHRLTYPKFIKAVTSAIMMKVTGTGRHGPSFYLALARDLGMDLKDVTGGKKSAKSRGNGKSNKPPGIASFWDYRPFSRIIKGRRDELNLRDYLDINHMEGDGVPREAARAMIKWDALKEDIHTQGLHGESRKKRAKPKRARPELPRS